MEQAEVSVEFSSRDLLDPDFQLDLDSVTETGDDGFDLGLDSNYDQVDYLDSGANAGKTTALNLGPELGYGHEDTPAEAAGSGEQQTTEVTQTAAGDAKAEVDYQDEIGYEDDDDHITTDFNADLETTEAPGANAGLSNVLSESRPEPVQVADEDHSEAWAQEMNGAMHQDLDPEEHGETIDQQDEYEDSNANEEDVADLMGDDDLAVDDFNDETAPEQYATDHYDEAHSDLSDLDQEIEDLAHSPAGIHDIEVLYNDECYSLIGTPDDDPNSYFLSDIDELDQPLSRFLSTLRAVISNEIAPTDELMVRFDPLNLEFGERSNDKFLSRSFREILDCHAALAAREAGIPPDPVIHLVVKRDSEDHFLELLADADLGDGQSHRAEDSEAAENNDEETRFGVLEDALVQDGAPEDRHSDEYSFDGDDTADPATHEQAMATSDERKSESELETAPDRDDMVDEQEHILDADAESSYSSIPPAECLDDNESLQDDSAEARDAVDEEQDWDEPAAEDGETSSPHAEIPPETSSRQGHEGTVVQDENEFAETTERDGTDMIAAPENGETEQGPGSNGKYLPFFPPAQHVIPATVSHQDDDMDTLIDQSDDEEHPVLASASGAVQKPSQQPARQAMVSAPGLAAEEDWFSEIDYSDDESERYSSSTPPSLQLISGDPIGDVKPNLPYPAQSQPACSWGFRSGPIIDHASSTGFLCSSRVSESSDISIALSFGTDANKFAFQDDDMNLNFDVDADLSMTREEVDEYEENTITYDVSESVADVADGLQEPHASEGTSGSTSKSPREETPVVAAADTASIHTSTTFNGDEIDYDELDGADDSFTPTGESVQQSAAASSGGADEIDWENDEEDDEQLLRGAEEDGEYEEPNEVTLTSPSIAGKRSRTDETESLTEETGMPACPPSKRMRLR